MAGLNLCTLFLLASLVCGGLAVAKASFTYKSAIGGSEELVRTRRATLVDPCPYGQVICEDGGDNYPTEVVKKLEAAGGGEYKHLFTVDPLPKPVARAEGDQGATMCRSRTHIIFPRRVLVPQSGWQHVVNGPVARQGLHVEVCLPHGSTCSYSELFPLGYKSTCTQKYGYRRILTIDPETQEHHVVNAPIPTCCACSITHEAR